MFDPQEEKNMVMEQLKNYAANNNLKPVSETTNPKELLPFSIWFNPIIEIYQSKNPERKIDLGDKYIGENEMALAVLINGEASVPVSIKRIPIDTKLPINQMYNGKLEPDGEDVYRGVGNARAFGEATGETSHVLVSEIKE